MVWIILLVVLFTEHRWCVLFGDRYPDKVEANNIRKLFSEPLTHWGDATCTFNDHIGVQTGAVKRNLHHSTSVIHNLYLMHISGNVQPIEENRKKLVPIVDTIKLCGHLGLPLCGHQDDSKYHPDVSSYSQGGVGNFIKLLQFLKSTLRNAKKLHIISSLNCVVMLFMKLLLRKLRNVSFSLS